MKSAQIVLAILVKLDCFFFFFLKELCSIMCACMHCVCVHISMSSLGFVYDIAHLNESQVCLFPLCCCALIFSIHQSVFSVKYRLMSCFLMHSYLLCSVDAPVTKSSSSYSGGPRIQRQEQVIHLSPKKGSQVGSRLLHITALKNDARWYLFTKRALSVLYNITNISLLTLS